MPGPTQVEAAGWGRLAGPRRPRADGLLDAREDGAREARPDPLAPGDVSVWMRAAGKTFRESFEALLASLPEERRDRLVQLSKESRGAWTLLLESPGGTALYCGNPLSGAVPPLAVAGYRVTLLDTAPERLWLALQFAEAQARGGARGVLGGDGARLPFEDDQFDVVVHDDLALDAARAAELRRVCRGELFVAGDNRLAYKRSSGRTWDFHVPDPLTFAGGVLRPRRGERTLIGWRRLLGGRGFARPAAYALYPDRRDFAQVVALDAPIPRLFVGPNERRNRLKVAAHRVGLFPLLTPSFGLHARRRDLPARPARLERTLDALAETTGEPAPRAEHLIGTRGNTAVIMTAVPGAAPEDPRGRWLIHVPLHKGHRRGLSRHLEMIDRVRADFPAIPVPEPLHTGEAAGTWLVCERRLPGFASNHVLTDRETADVILQQIAAHLTELVVRPGRPLSEADFDAIVAPWFEHTLRAVRDDGARNSLARRLDEARRLLIGRDLPLVLAHGDLRAKHVQVDAQHNVLGYLDWGTVMEPALPGLDLVHRLVHDRKQLLDQPEGEAWREVSDPQRLLPGERRALATYAERLAIEPCALNAVAQVYPVFIGAEIELFAPFVTTDWYRRRFGV